MVKVSKDIHFKLSHRDQLSRHILKQISSLCNTSNIYKSSTKSLNKAMILTVFNNNKTKQAFCIINMVKN